MRRSMPWLTAGLLAVTWAAVARADEPASCGRFGTSVAFEDSPSAAAKRAKKEEKLVFVLHVSGLFENSDFT